MDLVVFQGTLNVGNVERTMYGPVELFLVQNDKSRTWEENQRPIITVTTVEDFWSLYNHIETPSKLPFGSDCSLFKVLVRPDTIIS